MGAGEVAGARHRPVWRWIAPDAVDEQDAEHMRVDEALLAQVGRGALSPTVRCYTWSRPALTIGRMQDEDRARAEMGGLPIYRRPTGGRAVLHGGDLTIAVAASHDAIAPHLTSHGVLASYYLLMTPVRNALADFHVDTETGRNEITAKTGTIAGEDCFARAARCDVVDAKHGIKILGSAMKRTSAAILLQMSLRPTPEVDLFSRAFWDCLRSHYTRYLNIGSWDIITR